ncbi:mitochondrial fission 1 protein A isoform X2 [Arachis hypogaea]|uniref:mitochondrial fission 1 protein A isoform X2 n=1 Tax=Arachis hypogaea TaxID=3818 RepID=UPI0010FC4722|nr:mitochondrial fission 1 protein A-like [Arachis hypogaea]
MAKLEAKHGMIVDSVGNFSGKDQLPWCDPDIVAIHGGSQHSYLSFQKREAILKGDEDFDCDNVFAKELKNAGLVVESYWQFR